MSQQTGFTDFAQKNRNREALLEREIAVNLQGVSQTIESRSPILEVHSTEFTNELDGADLYLQVAARGSEERDIGRAQTVEDFDYAIYNDWTRRRTMRYYAPKRRALGQMVDFGLGILHLDFAPENRKLLYGKQVETVEDIIVALDAGKGFKQNMLIIECPDINAVFWEPDFSMVGEVGERTVSQVLAAYDGLDYDNEREFFTSETMEEFSGQDWWDRTCKVYHLETADWIYDVVKSARDPYELDRRPNVAGRPWYAFMAGHIRPGRSPAQMFRPLISALYPETERYNLLRTLLDNGAVLTGRPAWQEVASGGRATPFAEYVQEEAEKRPVVIFDTTEQQLPKPRKGYEWKIMPVPEPSWLKEAMEDARRNITEWGFPVALALNAPLEGSAESGVHAARQMEAAGKYLKPPLDGVAAAWHEIFSLVGDIIKGLGQPVTIPARMRAKGEDPRLRHPVTVKPEDFEEQDITVRFESALQAAKFSQRESDLRLLQAGMMSKATFMQKHYENPLDEEERIILDQGKQFTMQQIMQLVQQAILMHGPAIVSQELAEVEAPLPEPPPMVPQAGGPAPGEMTRNERPPQVVDEGVGMPIGLAAPEALVGAAQ